ncbi:bifunctional adenosylcobinamide kinase/adenosylcobinamide-phosphate guanylyltransferase [Falsigemmobacter faecalis]|uniref:bifunctional adenosylcobinamide kinase/adenosylcobinamide-phosphate guanylyltransferase n=1 Tax=Falsigemmobacter faecalis TaxID=2488730 RepID=UPI001F24E157|nr:bifunctional adenosylcobinamide kinase/adenosylcobinamide-phosphate guanylyltransferase [Falsigemmobacter faecalis]
MADLTLVIGGARSGKSRYAEGLVRRHPGPWHYIATAQAFDTEMADRIAQHRADRGPDWITHEAPLELTDALRGIDEGVVLVDCLTLWLSNHLLAGSDLTAEAAALEAALQDHPCPVTLVSNEVGWGIVPDNALARAFRDAQGRLNQRLAARARHVITTIAGLPLGLKGDLP